MPRKAGTKRPKNFAFSEEAYTKRYNPEVAGYGNPRQWRASMSERLGFEEAERIKSEAQTSGKWRSEYRIIGELAGVPLSESSMWSEIKSAFRRASMNCHPDRSTQHGKSVEVAGEEFKHVSAAYTILAHKYGKD